VIKIKFKKYYNYDVYEDGKVYSNYTNKFLKGEITKFGYLQYTLSDSNGKQFRIRAHRLVGQLFLDCPENYKELVINHKDGNKLNNHYSNLEWVTTLENNIHARENKLNNISKSNSERWKNKEWAKNTAKHMSEVALKTKRNEGKNNGRFRYEIYDKYDKEYSRTELAKFLGLSQSYTDSLIKKLSEHKEIKNKKVIEEGIYVIDIKGKS
jgi:hypothetical protein